MLIGIVYKILLLFPLIKSFILGRRYSFSTQNNLFIYLLVTSVNEWVSFVRNLINSNVKVGLQYNLYFIFCIFFFSFFFFKLFAGIMKKILILVTIFSLVYILAFTNYLSEDFDKKIGIIITLFYIVISLLWFYHKISFFDKYKINSDPIFWISTALLMWSCFFLFRVTPMFYFAKEDNEFLQFLRVGQNIINIGMYIMFYVALMKYEKKLKL